MNSKNEHINKLIIGLGIGLFLGGVISILVAPLSGQQLRDKIEDTYYDVRHRVKMAAHPEKFSRIKQ